jgi:hypothetical protein
MNPPIPPPAGVLAAWGVCGAIPKMRGLASGLGHQAGLKVAPCGVACITVDMSQPPLAAIVAALHAVDALAQGAP